MESTNTTHIKFSNKPLTSVIFFVHLNQRYCHWILLAQIGTWLETHYRSYKLINSFLCSNENCTPSFFCERENFAMFARANISRRDPTLVVYGCDNNMGLNTAYSRKLVVGNQFIFWIIKSLNYDGANKSWFTAYFMPIYMWLLYIFVTKISQSHYDHNSCMFLRGLNA